MPAHLMPLAGGIGHCTLWKGRKAGGGLAAAVGWPLLWALLLATDAQLEAKTHVWMLKGKLGLENRECSPASWLLGLADKVGEEGSK